MRHWKPKKIEVVAFSELNVRLANNRSSMALDGESSSEFEENHLNKKAVAKYSVLSESLRNSIPESKMCLMFCGGKNCKYENVTKWTNSQAITGLYSTWITPTILAMSRPNSGMMKEFNIVKQFKDMNINSLINLQMLGEHEHCGPGLESSGFTYEPQQFMDTKISFYNYGWRDYGIGSFNNLVDIIHVMQFSISEGKVAIHCHAGLGRTGVLIACYLIYTNRYQPQVAIHYVRSKRPGSIQSNSQIHCINEFYRIILSLSTIFNLSDGSSTASCTLSEHVTKQKYFVHGNEAKLLKYLPKIVFVCCNQLLDLAGALCTRKDHIEKRCSLEFMFANRIKNTNHANVNKKSNHLAPNLDVVARSISSESFCPLQLTQKVLSHQNLPLAPKLGCDNGDLKHKSRKERRSRAEIARVMSRSSYDRSIIEKVEKMKMDLNLSESGWKILKKEENPEVLACILWSWIDDLREPVLSHQDLPIIINEMMSFSDKIQYLEKTAVATISYLLSTCMALESDINSSANYQLMQRVISTVLQQNCVLERDDVTNDLEDEFFLRTSNQVGSVMRLDLSKKILKFLLTFSKFLINHGILCDCNQGK